MVPTVIVSGNHYVLDCVGSGVVLTACVLAERARTGRLRQRLQLRSRMRALVSRFPIRERRHNPDLRPLDRPLIISATMAVILAVSGDPVQRAVGLALLACAAAMPPLARYRIQHGVQLCADAGAADWWCGFLFLAGSTCVGASDPTARLCSTASWLAAGLLPMLARSRARQNGHAAGRRRAAVRAVSP